MKLKILILSIIISLFAAYPAKIFAGMKHNKHVARRAIAHYFCERERPYHLCSIGRQALNVADCETGGTFNPYASNGQYLGIFQMGSHERYLFGFGWNAWDQTRGAKKYFNYEVRNGYWGWNPWSCQPW
jgi:hypothetical protein